VLAERRTGWRPPQALGDDGAVGDAVTAGEDGRLAVEAEKQRPVVVEDPNRALPPAPRGAGIGEERRLLPLEREHLGLGH
jgi:hypothetical protein